MHSPCFALIIMVMLSKNTQQFGYPSYDSFRTWNEKSQACSKWVSSNLRLVRLSTLLFIQQLTWLASVAVILLELELLCYTTQEQCWFFFFYWTMKLSSKRHGSSFLSVSSMIVTSYNIYNNLQHFPEHKPWNRFWNIRKVLYSLGENQAIERQTTIRRLKIFFYLIIADSSFLWISSPDFSAAPKWHNTQK